MANGKSHSGAKKNEGYSFWLFQSKGTVAEPWPTEEDLLADSEVSQIIERHNKFVRSRTARKDSKTRNGS